MLYRKSHSDSLDMSEFKQPSSEYRAAPFWAWNCKLEESELLWQIEQFKRMGLGGFYMHTRSGLETEYLGDEFMKLIKACSDKAIEEGMFAYLYDEDRWPSGAAGGFVTKNPKFRQRRLLFTETKRDCDEKAEAIEKGNAYLLGIYDIVLNAQGELADYRLITDEKDAVGRVRYAYIEVYSSFNKSPGWYNGGTYVDTLGKKAIEEFVSVTHERYKEIVGDRFGESIPAIFTDEPQFSHYVNLPSAESTADAAAPWTVTLEERFAQTYGYRIQDKLPELFWELAGGEVSVARYHFHDLACEMFVAAFSDTIGRWCEQNGIAFTGHLYGEASLLRQTATAGESMRSYRSFQLPGVDMLFNRCEYDTVKQVQSAIHQYGREGGSSELYGVTNWDFDFRGHKFQGDWQAALGITMRVPHLSWVSMKGAAKRDYPASISYQSPWYEEYPYIEDHFARVNTVLTRGEAVVNVGVIHPIESYWLHFGPDYSTLATREEMEKKFNSIIDWLLFDNIDFDFICESSIPSLLGAADDRFHVGKASYSAIVVPACETLRKTTVDALNAFIAHGGKVIFAGTPPKYIDAIPNPEINALYERAIRIPFEKYQLTKALESERTVEIKTKRGERCGQFLYQLRRDRAESYLFIANAKPRHTYNYTRINGTEPPVETVITVKGEYRVTLLNTMTGEEELISYAAKDGCTAVDYVFHENDSLLLRLIPDGVGSHTVAREARCPIGSIDFKREVEYVRHEDNVCLLDLAEYALDGDAFEDTEEILRIDVRLREKFSWPLASGTDMQPWAMKKEKTEHFVLLRFTFHAETALENVSFCAEELDALTLNGKEVALSEQGYFVDKSIRKYALPPLCEGENVIVAKIPFSKHDSLEACYLTGDFDVILKGCEKTLVKPGDKIGFGDITGQGMPFYGGNITYREKIVLTEDCEVCVNIAKYIGALTKVTLDGKNMGNIVFAPYELSLGVVAAGEHTIEFTLFGNRHNTFGGLHNCGLCIYYGQKYWYSVDDAWSYEYNLKKTGILKSPVIKLYPRA